MSVNKVFALVSSVAVAIVLLIGLYLGGSPAEQRLVRFDERRVSDLRMISNAIQRRWERSGALPGSLDALVQGQQMRRLPLDPESAERYEFEIVSETSYRLCARFSRATVKPMPGDFWAHEAGRQCFTINLAEEGQ
jgi:hypothetical protein